MDSTLRAVLGSGHDVSNKSWHSQLKETQSSCTSPRHSTTTAQGSHWRCDCPTLLLSLQLSRGWGLTPKNPWVFLGQERCRGLKGTKFINLERHKSSQSSAPITMSSGSTGEIWECSFSPGQWQNTLLTKSLCDTILFPDFRWQLHSKSMDLLENCILYFSRWVWVDFGVGCLGGVFVLSGLCLLGVFLQSLYKLLWWQFIIPDWVCLCYF